MEKLLFLGVPKLKHNRVVVPNGKLMVLGVPIFEHIIIRLKCTQIWGHIKIMNFPFGANGKFIIFRSPKT